MVELVIAFERTIDAIGAEKRLAEGGLRPLVMPLPPAIRAGCGLCLRVRPRDLEAAMACLAGVPASWHVRRALPGGSRYEPLEVET